MNVEEIKVQAQLYMSMQMQLAYCIKFINECLNELGTVFDTACKRDSVDLDIIKDTWVDLPSDFTKVKEIKLNGYKYSSYEIENNQIRCSDPGSFNISYLRLPKPVASKTDIPEIHPSYHYSVALYVASREKSRLFGDEDTENVRFMNEFVQKSNLIHTRLRKKPRRIRV